MYPPGVVCLLLCQQSFAFMWTISYSNACSKNPGQSTTRTGCQQMYHAGLLYSPVDQNCEIDVVQLLDIMRAWMKSNF
jgi:hypothetical protein